MVVEFQTDHLSVSNAKQPNKKLSVSNAKTPNKKYLKYKEHPGLNPFSYL